MNSGNLPAILFMAAVLSASKRLDCQARSRVISCAGSFNTRTEIEAIEGLLEAFHRADVPVPPKRFLYSAFPKAAVQAQKWIEQGIGAIVSTGLDVSVTERRAFPPLLFTKGDPSLLREPIAAVFNSRKPRGAAPDDVWIIAARSLVGFALKQGYTLASSYGNTAYSLTACLAKGFPTIIVCYDVLPFMEDDFCLSEFLSCWEDLFDWGHTLFVSSFPPGTKRAPAVRSGVRDHVVAALASVLLVADVRPGGNMALVIETARRRGTLIGSSSTAGSLWRRSADFVVSWQAGESRSISSPAILPVQDAVGPRQSIGSKGAAITAADSSHSSLHCDPSGATT